MLDDIDPRIADIVREKAGDKLDIVLIAAEDIMRDQGKTAERALADALQKFKLV